jgi:hypothetical protein
VQWPEQYWTERKFHHVHKSRFAGQPVGVGQITEDDATKAREMARRGNAEAVFGDAHRAKESAGKAAAERNKSVLRAAEAELESKVGELVELAIEFDEVRGGE